MSQTPVYRCLKIAIFVCYHRVMRLCVALVFLLFSPLFVNAQFSGFGVESELSIQSEPQYPSPGTQATLSLDDYSGGAFGAEIAWYLNDTFIPGSQNARSVVVQVGAAGKTDVVKAVLTTNGISRVLTKNITPYYLDIIIEPQTHVPGFYKGRALPSIDSTVYATGFLSDGSTFKPRDLLYLWKINQTVIEGGPLRNRNTISFTMPRDSYSTLSLQVSTPTGEILAKRTIGIPTVSPQVHFYEVNALYGVESRSLKEDFNMIGESATIIAEPYYLDSNIFNYPSLLEWKINDELVSGGNNPYTITLQKTGYPGAATLNFHVRSTTRLLQGGRQQLTVNI